MKVDFVRPTCLLGSCPVSSSNERVPMGRRLLDSCPGDVKEIVALAVCLLIGSALAGQPALAAFTTGFEASEGYVGVPGSAGNPPGPSQLVPQNGWVNEFGNYFDVHTYDGAQIPWTQGILGPILSPAPVHPCGGDQFVALGTSDSSGGGRDMHTATFTGLVEMSADYAPGSEFDNGGNYNGALLARANGVNVFGLYTGKASTAPTGNPSPGPWAWVLWAFDAAGTKIVNHGLGYRFNGVAGFDDLTMEAWYRMGVVVDMTTRRIVQIKSMELVTGQTWILNDPAGPAGELLYIDGGSTGASIPSHVGIFNVGNGTLSMFDNVYVGVPYTWTCYPPRSGTVLIVR
jgi:hypothetical protein